MASKKERLYKVRSLPASVEKALRAAAREQEIPLRRAFRYVLAAETDIAETLRLGQEADTMTGKRGLLQFQLPAKEKDLIELYAATAGLDQSDVGRLVLIRWRNVLPVRIVLGVAAKVPGVTVFTGSAD